MKNFLKIALLIGFSAGLTEVLCAQLLSYDFDGESTLFANKGSLGGDFDLKSKRPVQGGDGSGVGGRGLALDLTAAPVMGGGEGLYLYNEAKGVFPAQRALTITGWYRTESGQSIYEMPVVLLRDGAGGSASSGFLLGSTRDKRLRLMIGNGEVAIRLSSDHDVFVAEGKWVFFAVTWNGENGEWMWYSGSEQDSVAPAGSGNDLIAMADAPPGELSIGRANSGSGAFKGWLDDIRVYDKALSESEIESVRRSDLAGK